MATSAPSTKDTELLELHRCVEELNKELEDQRAYAAELEELVVDAAVASERGTYEDGMAIITAHIGDSDLWDDFQEKLNDN